MPPSYERSYIQRWRDRAAEMRTAAAGMTADIRAKMLTLADEWEKMADELEARLADDRGR